MTRISSTRLFPVAVMLADDRCELRPRSADFLLDSPSSLYQDWSFKYLLLLRASSSSGMVLLSPSRFEREFRTEDLLALGPVLRSDESRVGMGRGLGRGSIVGAWSGRGGGSLVGGS